MNKTLFLLVCLVGLALSESSCTIVTVSEAAPEMNLCAAKSTQEEGVCGPKKAQSYAVTPFEEEGVESFTVWQAFHHPAVFPYSIEDLYFMVSAMYDDEVCDVISNCLVPNFTITVANVKEAEVANGAKGCSNYTLVPGDKTFVTRSLLDIVTVPKFKSNSFNQVAKIHLDPPINVLSPLVYIGVTISVPEEQKEKYGTFYIYGSKQLGSTYCNPHKLENVIEEEDVNPFESIMLNAHISLFEPQTTDELPGWTKDIKVYNDTKCDCNTGITDRYCAVNPKSADCKADEVCWEGSCKKIGWVAEASRLYKPDYQACDISNYGTDDKCELGCSSNAGRGSMDPDCFFGDVVDISYSGASRECSRYDGKCGAEQWKCEMNKFNDGELCDCNCGAQDIDCNNVNLTTTCEGDLMCEGGECTIPKNWTCDRETYNDGVRCDCECGAIDPDCYIMGCSSTCINGYHCNSKAHCIISKCGDGEVDPSSGDQCDSGKHCKDDCKCDSHYERTYPPGPDCQPICGDGYPTEEEECDGTGGCLPNCTCDKKYKSEGGVCVGCGNGVVDKGEECDGGENCNSATCRCNSGYQSESGTNGCSKKSNLVVIIVVSVAAAVVVIAAACVIIFVLVPIIHRKRDGGDSDGGDIVMDPIGDDGTGGPSTTATGTSVSPLNSMCVLTAGSPKMTAAPFVGQRNYIKETWSVNPEETDFNTSGLEVEVGATQQQVFELRNMAPSQMQFSVNVPRSNKFLVTVFPEKGAVASGSSTTFKVQITLYCNVKLDQVPFAVSVQFDGEEKNQQYILVPMNICAQRSNRIDYDDLVFEETVGEGSFGSVWRGKYQNQVVAIKTLRTITESALKDFLREIEMLAQFKNPYIMGYFGSVITNDKLCMVIEYLAKGSLSAILKQNHLSPRLKTRLALDSVKGLAYLHTLNIMHRDIKPGNVLVSSYDPSLPDAICKIADFGTSRVLNGSAEDQAALQKGLGTPLYMAPEILGSNKTYTQSADVYSFGIMLAHIWNEKSPYSDLHFDTPWALANYVSSGNRPQIDEGCPQAYYQLMTQCWQADPSQRPSFQQCVEFLEQLNHLFAEQPEEPGFVHVTQKLE